MITFCDWQAPLPPSLPFRPYSLFCPLHLKIPEFPVRVRLESHHFSRPASRLEVHGVVQTPSTALRHPSFGGRLRKAMLGVWVLLWPGLTEIWDDSCWSFPVVTRTDRDLRWLLLTIPLLLIKFQGFKVLLSFLPVGARKRSYIRTRHSLWTSTWVLLINNYHTLYKKVNKCSNTNQSCYKYVRLRRKD